MKKFRLLDAILSDSIFSVNYIQNCLNLIKNGELYHQSIGKYGKSSELFVNKQKSVSVKQISKIIKRKFTPLL